MAEKLETSSPFGILIVIVALAFDRNKSDASLMKVTKKIDFFKMTGIKPIGVTSDHFA